MDRRIRRTKSVLDQQYRDPPSLEALAEDAGLSVSRLAHLFRDETGMSIQSYIVERRLLMAAMLIVQSDEQISQIAYRVGFGDVSNFNHSFKRRFAMSPREYRASHEGPEYKHLAIADSKSEQRRACDANCREDEAHTEEIRHQMTPVCFPAPSPFANAIDSDARLGHACHERDQRCDCDVLTETGNAEVAHEDGGRGQ